MSVGLMAHLSACIFYYMAYLDNLGPQTWVYAYGVQDAGESQGRLWGGGPQPDRRSCATSRPAWMGMTRREAGGR